MPIEKSSFKDLRKSKKRAARNKKVKASIDFLLRKARQAVVKKDAKSAEVVARAIKALDKAAGHGVIKMNTAARLKSRIMKKLNSAKKA